MNAASVTAIVKWLALTVVSLDGALVAFILYRRAIRSQFYRQQDAALGHFSGIVEAYLTGTLTLQRATVLLKVGGQPEREAAKKLLLGSIHANRGAVTQLLIALGFVNGWAEQAFGRRRAHELLRSMQGQSCIRRQQAPKRTAWRWIRRLRLFSVSRAVAIGHLGRLSPEFSSVFIREALRDPSHYVTRTCVASIGRNPIPEGVSVLLEELRKAVNGETELPIRSIKTALVRYPVTELRHFTPFMDNSNPQFRFLAVDTIREICRKAQGTSPATIGIPPKLRSWFLEKAVRDDSADVRARSAVVGSYLRDPSATEALRLLLRDESEFVRLHSVRACADPYYSNLVGDILQRITDEKWRVREAAVRTLASFHELGWERLQALLINTTDRYASEQIVDELQRSGMALQIVSKLASGDEASQAFDVCSKMVRVGMVSLLTGMLNSNQPPQLRMRLFEVLSRSEAPEFVCVLQRIADSETDPLRNRAESLLRERRGNAARAVGEQA